MASWVSALIAGAAGVAGGVGGAYVGARAALKLTLRGEAERRQSAKVDAFAAYYTAVMQIGDFYNVWAELLPNDSYLSRVRLGIQMAGQREQLIMTRFFSAIDAYWASSARVRTVANERERAVVDEMDAAIGGLKINEPVTDEWRSAVRRLRQLLEGFSATD